MTLKAMNRGMKELLFVCLIYLERRYLLSPGMAILDHL